MTPRERIDALERRLARVRRYAEKYLDHPNPLNTLAYELMSDIHRIVDGDGAGAT